MIDPVAHIPPLPPLIVEGVADDARREVLRQDKLARQGRFGGTHVMPGGPDDARLTVLVEEVGEVAEWVNEERQAPGELSSGALYEELIQVAACAIAWATAVLEDRAGIADTRDTG